MRVVNLTKERCDFRGCRKRDNSIPDPPEEGFLGNPFFLKNTNDDEERLKVVSKYKHYFYKRIRNDEGFRNAVLSLEAQGIKTIGCFCHPKPCHLDVVVEYLQEQKRIMKGFGLDV